MFWSDGWRWLSAQACNLPIDFAGRRYWHSSNHLQAKQQQLDVHNHVQRRRKELRTLLLRSHDSTLSERMLERSRVDCFAKIAVVWQGTIRNQCDFKSLLLLVSLVSELLLYRITCMKLQILHPNHVSSVPRQLFKCTELDV